MPLCAPLAVRCKRAQIPARGYMSGATPDHGLGPLLAKAIAAGGQDDRSSECDDDDAGEKTVKRRNSM